MNYEVGAWPCARPVKGDHKGRPYPTIAQRANFHKLLDCKNWVFILTFRRGVYTVHAAFLFPVALVWRYTYR